MFDSLWVEKYRPKCLEDILLTEKLREYFNTLSEESEIPNMLFVGNPGIGKTSLAKIISNNILKCQYIYINASDENGIDTIRSKVVSFAQTKSIDGKLKTIILDEVDGLTIDAQRALRNTMEEYAGNTRFILTANYHYRVIEPIQSRCQSFSLSFPLDDAQKRAETILEDNTITVSDDTALKELVRKHYPDLRKAINELQKRCIDGKFTVHEEKEFDDFVSKIYKLSQTKHIIKARRYVIENEETFNGDYGSLMKELFNRIESEDIDFNKKREQLLKVSEYMFRSSHVLDQEINFFSCLLALSE